MDAFVWPLLEPSLFIELECEEGWEDLERTQSFCLEAMRGNYICVTQWEGVLYIKAHRRRKILKWSIPLCFSWKWKKLHFHLIKGWYTSCICASDLTTPKHLAVTVLNLNYEYNAGVQCSNYSFNISKWRTDELICDPIWSSFEHLDTILSL